jgi:hypothetical protein
MAERTVTEQQVIDAMNKYGSQEPIGHFEFIYDELFPELPKAGELVFVWDNGEIGRGGWFPFVELDCGVVMVTDLFGDKESWDNYRRQTPSEKGEG